MKNKKGFVFVETMIVVVVLVSILLIIYSSYTSLISLERRLARYDDPAFIYRTNAITKFLLSIEEDGNSTIGKKINEFDVSGSNFIQIWPNDNDLFKLENSTKANFFNQVYNNFNVQSLIIINGAKLKTLEKDTVSLGDFYRYLKTLDTTDEDQFYIVAMYAEKINGDPCNPNDLYNKSLSQKNDGKQENTCTYYYANLKLESEELS